MSLDRWRPDTNTRGAKEIPRYVWIATGQLASTANFEASDANRRQAPSRQL